MTDLRGGKGASVTGAMAAKEQTPFRRENPHGHS